MRGRLVQRCECVPHYEFSIESSRPPFYERPRARCKYCTAKHRREECEYHGYVPVDRGDPEARSIAQKGAPGLTVAVPFFEEIEEYDYDNRGNRYARMGCVVEGFDLYVPPWVVVVLGSPLRGDVKLRGLRHGCKDASWCEALKTVAALGDWAATATYIRDTTEGQASDGNSQVGA